MACYTLVYLGGLAIGFFGQLAELGKDPQSELSVFAVCSKEHHRTIADVHDIGCHGRQFLKALVKIALLLKKTGQTQQVDELVGIVGELSGHDDCSPYGLSVIVQRRCWSWFRTGGRH